MKITNPIALRLGRLLAFVFMLFCVLVFSAGIFFFSSYAAKHPGDFTNWDWTPDQMEAVLRQIGLSYQWWLQWELVSSVVFAALICGIGFFIFFRIKDDWFSLFVSLVFVLFGALAGYPAYALAGTYPSLEPIVTLLTPVAWVGLLLIFYGFPDGKFVPRSTRWGAALLVIVFGIDIIFSSGEGPPPPALLLLMFLGFAIAPISQVYRYRKVSNLIQRQQTKWVMVSFLLIVFLGLLPTIGGLFFPELRNPDSSLAIYYMLLNTSTVLLLGLLPLSIAFAMLRYRLWDVDVIIRRTLVYGVLTVALVLVFFGGVTLMQALFQAVSGERSAASVVISTLAIYVLFNPLRKRVQDFIDRRFYRKKYNAEQALKKFTELARSETDIEQLSAEIMAVVQETMQPEKSFLWLKEVKK